MNVKVPRKGHVLRQALCAIVFGLAALALAVPARATLILCSSGPGIDLVNDGCYAPGNDNITSVLQAILNATGSSPSNLTLYGKSDANPSLFQFTPTNPHGAFSGTWSVLDGTLISYLTVKAGNQFALYQLSPPANSGVWTTAGLLVGRGNQPELSHLSFWTTSESDPGALPGVPEPATMALLGGGLVALAIRLRARTSGRRRAG